MNSTAFPSTSYFIWPSTWCEELLAANRAVSVPNNNDGRSKAFNGAKRLVIPCFEFFVALRTFLVVASCPALVSDLLALIVAISLIEMNGCEFNSTDLARLNNWEVCDLRFWWHTRRDAFAFKAAIPLFAVLFNRSEHLFANKAFSWRSVAFRLDF
jgi:hypothetical protein